MDPIRTDIIGVDEVGRGAWAGPLVCAAVRFHTVPTLPRGIAIRDSKVLSASQREKAARFIRTYADISLAFATRKEIDTLGIQRANVRVFEKAVRKIGFADDALIRIDGRRICTLAYPHEFLVAGDKKCMIIAAASIVAKVCRDRLMARFSARYPHYGFDRNKGYGTREHQIALKAHGFSAIHRRSFSLACYTH